MFFQGMAGFHRRAFDGGKAYEQVSQQIFAEPNTFLANVAEFFNVIEPNAAFKMIDLNIVTSGSAWLLAVFQVPFIINLFISVFIGKKVTSDNPWDATTLEWATPTPPPHGNFATEPVAYRGPYEYSVPGAPRDFTPQSESNPALIVGAEHDAEPKEEIVISAH
jgi:cytochrome c oxidase subunit 1